MNPGRHRKHSEDSQFLAVFDELDRMSLFRLYCEKNRLEGLRNSRDGYEPSDNLRLRAVLAVIKKRVLPSK